MSVARLVGVLATLIIGFILWWGFRAVIANANELGYYPHVLKATKTGPHTASLHISTWPDSYQCHGNNGAPGGGPRPDWVSYCPTTALEVPANTLVTVTITNYDEGDTVKNPFFAHVWGTKGDVETVYGGKTQHGFNPNQNVSHTFTVESVPNSPAQKFISVPIAPVLGGDNPPTPLTLHGSQYPKPAVTKFSFYSGTKGRYIWKCYVPCGSGLYDFQEGFGGPMGTTGYMAGYLNVV
jgi:hypothetical protein